MHKAWQVWFSQKGSCSANPSSSRKESRAEAAGEISLGKVGKMLLQQVDLERERILPLSNKKGLARGAKLTFPLQLKIDSQSGVLH